MSLGTAAFKNNESGLFAFGDISKYKKLEIHSLLFKTLSHL